MKIVVGRLSMSKVPGGSKDSLLSVIGRTNPIEVVVMCLYTSDVLRVVGLHFSV